MLVIGELDWGAGVWALSLGVPAALLFSFALWLEPHMTKAGRVVLIYPLQIAALILAAIVALGIAINLFGPIILALWTLVVQPIWHLVTG